jgi:hypothetical protein
MTYSEAEILTGDQKSLVEVRRKRDQMLDFLMIWPIRGFFWKLGWLTSQSKSLKLNCILPYYEAGT